MADLSTLDATKPDNAELARQGAGRIRDVALATKTSVAVEHSLTGEHKFLSGTTASRPAPGKAGRIYFNTDHGSIEYDDGAAWAILRVGGVGRNTLVGTSALTGSFVSYLSVSVNVSLNAYVLVHTTFQIAFASTGNDVVQAKLQIGGVDYGLVWEFSNTNASALATKRVVSITDLITTGVVEGVQSVDLLLKVTAGSASITNRAMITRAV